MAENKNIVIRLMADTASYEAAMTRAGSTAKTVASGMENTGRKSALIASGMTERVIDDLEVIEINKKHRQHMIFAL